MNHITFPNLNLDFNIDPVAFTLFGKEVYWYGVIIISGIILALFLANRRLKKTPDVEKFSMKIDWNAIVDLVLWMIPLGIVGARLYFCAFKWDYYSNHLDEIFAMWNGGLAIYGGVIGGVLTGYIFCKVRKIQFLDMADFCVPYLAMCQSIGRWGNFVNAEAHGVETDSFLKMGIVDKVTGEFGYYHPTFLYESICTFIIFLILIRLSKNRKFVGQIFTLYFILYGFARFFIEGLRTDSLYIADTSIRVSQALSLLLVVVFWFYYIYRRFEIRSRIEKLFSK
jgi:phosphatidylglycerol:prolipoprotein diacylglycerol transferase